MLILVVCNINNDPSETNCNSQLLGPTVEGGPGGRVPGGPGGLSVDGGGDGGPARPIVAGGGPGRMVLGGLGRGAKVRGGYLRVMGLHPVVFANESLNVLDAYRRPIELRQGAVASPLRIAAHGESIVFLD